METMTIAVAGVGELAPHLLQRCRQHPILERGAVAQSARLAGENRNVVPGIIDRLAPAKAAAMLGDDAPILSNDDAFGIGVDLDRPANRAGVDGVSVVVEPHEAGLRHRSRQRVESIEATAMGNELGPLLLEDFPDGPVRTLGMGMRLGVGDALIDEPGIQLIVGFDPQPWREEAFADKADLVLDLTLLPT